VLVLAVSAAEAQPWAENRPPAGGAHSLPARLFPVDNWFNLKITDAAVDPGSVAYLANFTGAMNNDWGNNYGIPWSTVSSDHPKITLAGCRYASESDMSVEYPIPAAASTEIGWSEELSITIASTNFSGDRHLHMVDPAGNKLYELYNIFHNDTGSPVTYPGGGGGTVPAGDYWCGSAAYWDMDTNGTRPDGWTSSTAAGTSQLAGLVQYDEVESGDPIPHAHGMTLNLTASNWYVWPATHHTSSGGILPLGTRMRLKPGKTFTGACNAHPGMLRLMQAYKDYGLIVTDNGISGQVSGTNDERWGDYDSVIRVAAFSCHTQIDMSDDLEIIKLGYGYISSYEVKPTDTTVLVRYGARGIPYETDCATVLKDSGGTPITTDTSTEGYARRTASFTGLTASTTYKVTTTCQGQMPPPVASAGVYDIPFTTLATVAGDRTIPVSIGTPSAALVAQGAARCTVDYDDNAALTSPTSVQDTSCSSGGSVDMTVPAGITYYRHRWQTAADAVLATGTVQALAVP